MKRKVVKVSLSKRRKERLGLIRRIKHDGGPFLLEKVADTGVYVFNRSVFYYAKTDDAAIKLYADTIIRVSDFLRGIRETT